MTEHFTKATVSAAAYCKKCKKNTQHQVWDGRLGACLDCLAELQRQHDAKRDEPEAAAKQEKLF